MSSHAIVVIPVKNEADHITDCLQALAAQSGHAIAFEVLLFINNSNDDTAAIAQALAPSLPYTLRIVVATLPPADASAGGARRHAMEAAARLLEERGGSGLLFTTDADSRVESDWIANTMTAMVRADAVAGTIVLDPADEAKLPAALKARGALEACYENLVCELETRLDPVPHDPWPCHATNSGASLALTLASFRAIGGIPNLDLGEDRALVQALKLGGFRVRHAPEVRVVTSGRLIGRAAGGCADTMRLRIDDPRARCDPYLRPVRAILRGEREADPPLRPSALRGQIALARCVVALLKLQAWIVPRRAAPAPASALRSAALATEIRDAAPSGGGA